MQKLQRIRNFWLQILFQICLIENVAAANLVLDLDTSSIDSLVSSLTIHAKVMTNQFDLCANSTCSSDQICRLVPHQVCDHPSCEPNIEPTCFTNLTQSGSASVKATGLTEELSPHAPSSTSKRLMKRASKKPQLVNIIAAPPVFHPKREGNGMLTSPEMVAVALLTGDVDAGSRTHKGDGFTLDLHPNSACKRLPSNFDLGIILLDPIAIQANAAVGRVLSKKETQGSGAVYTTYFDGYTDIFLYHFTSKKMRNVEARKYCQSLGLGLPTLTSQIDLARISPFVSIHSDFWLDGHDESIEGTWRSFYDNQLLNRLPWASGIEGRHNLQDCLKLR